jgi:putative serine protease PepD
MSESQPASRRPSPLGLPVLVGSAVGIAAVAALVAGLIVHFSDEDTGLSGAVAAAASSTRCPASTIADGVLPSVVTLSVHNGASSGTGSGEIIRDSGYILTNDHVISAGVPGGTIDILFTNGQTERATVVGRVIALDLAVVKVAAPEKLPTIGIGRSEALRVGQPVVALGAPLGLSGTVTSGIVSALGRDVTVPAEGGQQALLIGAIQTDAAINPGNSGGPLVDCAGRLVGVNTAGATVPNAAGVASGGSVGIGFAIPSDLATIVADQLIAHGRFSPPYFGAATLPIPAGVQNSSGAPNGLYVLSVTKGGPAAAAGLATGDVITHVDGQPTTGPDSIYLIILKKKPGDRVSVEYVHAGKAATTTVTLAARP